MSSDSSQFSFLSQIKDKPKLVIIVDENLSSSSELVKKLLNNVSSLIGSSSLLVLTLPSGEKSKSIDVLYPLFQPLIEFGADRSTTIVALGGGVCGDAAGFIASIYLRGVPLIQIPSTLLSMVDSSIGGKVAINHNLGKNLIGAFYPPNQVIIDPEILTSLPDREFRSGIAECIKHGLIEDSNLLKWLSDNNDLILKRDLDALIELINVNLEIKKSVVERDENESGDRAFLNLGHTFAHAIEKEFSCSSQTYLQGSYLHGEAVAIGLVAASYLSHIRHQYDKKNIEILIQLLKLFNLPYSLRSTDTPEISNLLLHMERDKKKSNSRLTMVLLDKDSKPVLDSNTSREEREEAWKFVLSGHH